MPNKHGDWIWYELMTPDADAARAFYEPVVGWRIEAAPSGPIDYRMIAASEGNVAGVLPLSGEMIAGGARPGWLGYLAVDDVDRTAAAAERAGGRTVMPARDMDGVGRIAMLADPQGAPFYVMKPTPPADAPDMTSHAFAAERPMMGHCAWNELATTDPAGGRHFYEGLFGWAKDGEMDMGPMGKYEFMRHGAVIGAIMPKPPQMPAPSWTFYFRVPDVDAAAATVRAMGGQVAHGPSEVPGNDFIVIGVDPQGATFALVGGRG